MIIAHRASSPTQIFVLEPWPCGLSQHQMSSTPRFTQISWRPADCIQSTCVSPQFHHCLCPFHVLEFHLFYLKRHEGDTVPCFKHWIIEGYRDKFGGKTTVACYICHRNACKIGLDSEKLAYLQLMFTREVLKGLCWILGIVFICPLRSPPHLLYPGLCSTWLSSMGCVHLVHLVGFGQWRH